MMFGSLKMRDEMVDDGRCVVRELGDGE